MSAVTLVTSNREIHRFPDLRSAEIFRAAMLEHAPHNTAPVGSVSPRTPQVLAHLALAAGPVESTDLMHAIGLTRPTASRILNHLVAEGFIEQVGIVPRTGAKVYRITDSGMAEVEP